MTVEAWFLDDNARVAMDKLSELGVEHLQINADDYEEELDKLCKERNVGLRQIVDVNAEAMPDFEEKLKVFYTEHLHEYDEIRYILGGSGYFDVRDKQERWIRIKVQKNDILVLPAGIYHRFAADETRNTRVMRLFSLAQENPVWNPLARAEPSTDKTTARVGYVSTFLQ